MKIRSILLAVGLVVGLLAPAAPVRAQGKTVTITGGGYGHGIGMSQWGTYGRAKNGKSATQIIEKYYTGAKVVERTIKGNVKVGLLPGTGTARHSISFTTEPFGSGSGKVTVKVQGQGKALVTADSGADIVAEASSTGGFKLSVDGTRVKQNGRSVFGDSTHPLIVNFSKHGSLFAPSGKSHKYAYGKAEIGSYSSGSCGKGYCARLVLKINMQKYLYGLGEVPSSWPHAALETQAIAGRTYALNKKLDALRQPCGCHVLDSTLDQAYIGDSKRTGSGQWWDDWKGAVDNTKNKVIVYSDDVLDYSLYSASSGGHTESNSAVWGSSPVPYLKPVSDKADRAGGDNPHYKWDPITMTWSEFSKKLNASFGTGELQDFELVKPFGESGRVTVPNDNGTGGVRIDGSSKDVRVSGWSIRSALGLKDTLFRVDISRAVAKRFRARYNDLNGAPGEPTSGAYKVPKGAKTSKGTAQDFRKGRMTHTKSIDKVVWQYGKVLKAYDHRGRERSKLGMPASGVWGKGFQGATYTNGTLVYSKGRGGISVLGPFDAAYQSHGGTGGALGLPLDARSGGANYPDGGRKQRFDGGTLYKAGSGGGVYALFGDIDERYRKMKAAAGDCGYPTADMTKAKGRWKATFANGSIVETQSGDLRVDCQA